MGSNDCPDCKRLFDAARDAIQTHIRAQGDWQVASLRRDDVDRVAQLRTAQDTAAQRREVAVAAYREHARGHESVDG
jgi:hypothetical protein